ncbi:MAG: sensor histidine kinase, partial [Oscillospiraceae bacterium]|nr:sensor histidine kinase [Oscillospiraceae bacterium]
RLLAAAEAALCCGYAFFWTPALLGLMLPVLGILENRWAALEREMFRKEYEDRSQRLKLEDMRGVQSLEIRHAANLAEIAERSRIAQEIHDNVGHEISGASLALQTAIKLYEKGDARAGELLLQTAARLESANTHLRETVHNLKPARTLGSEELARLCEEFSFCPVSFTGGGDLAGTAHWELLYISLKEALTNIARHSNATSAAVRLDGNARYIRMRISDNGRLKSKPKLGLGLTGMDERVRAAGGTLTISAESGFQIVCVLPKTTGGAP